MKRLSQLIHSGAHADPEALALGPLDEAIFHILEPQYGKQFLPSNFIHALLPLYLPDGRYSVGHVANRLARLGRQPHAYLTRRQERQKHGVYSRTHKADDHLDERPVRRTEGFEHQVLEHIVQASLDLGMHEAGLTRKTWPAIARMGSVPNETLTAKKPHELDTPHGKLIHDGTPFLFHDHGGTGITIIGKEIDRATEHKGSRSNLVEKYQKIKHIFDQKIWSSHYGFKNAFVLFVFTSEDRMHNFLDHIKKETGACKYILCTYTKDWGKQLSYPPPSSTFFTRPWQRAGHSDFYLSTMSDTPHVQSQTKA